MKKVRGHVGRLDRFRPAHSIFYILVDFIYPPYCLLCESRLAQVSLLLCPNCQEALPHRKDAWQPVHALDLHISGEPHFAHSFAAFEYSDNIQQLIHETKYKNMSRLGRFLGENMAAQFPRKALDSIDALVPVPLYSARYRERGFNQSEEICKGISQSIGLPIWSSALVRTRHTQQQAKFSREQRMNNVRGAFRVKHADSVTGKRFALVDDVMTTGSTMNECAKCLKQAGAEQVIVLSIARI